MPGGSQQSPGLLDVKSAVFQVVPSRKFKAARRLAKLIDKAKEKNVCPFPPLHVDD